MNPEVHNAATSIIASAEKEKESRLQNLAEESRKCPNGSEFYYPSTSGEPERSYIQGVFLSGFEIDDIQVWYRCHVPSWTPESFESMPLSESVIARAIEKFGIPS